MDGVDNVMNESNSPAETLPAERHRMLMKYESLRV